MVNIIVGLYRSLLASIGAIAFGFLMLITIFGLVALLFSKCKLFSKCGYSWWLGLIPLYSEYIFYTKICGLHWAWFVAWIAMTVLSFEETTVTFFKLFVNGMAYYNLAKKCNRDTIASMIFGAMFPHFVNIVYAYSSAKYDKDVEVKQSGLF